MNNAQFLRNGFVKNAYFPMVLGVQMRVLYGEQKKAQCCVSKLHRYCPMRTINKGDSLKMYTRGRRIIICPDKKSNFIFWNFNNISSETLHNSPFSDGGTYIIVGIVICVFGINRAGGKGWNLAVPHKDG